MQQIPNAGAIFLCDQIGPDLANSKLRLFVQGFTPVPGDTLASLVANECTFSGYNPGGYTLATWSNGMLQGSGGAWTASPQVDVYFIPPGSGSAVTQNVGGWFLVDSTGNLVADGTFTPVVPMNQNGNGFTISIALLQGEAAVAVACWVDGVQQG